MKTTILQNWDSPLPPPKTLVGRSKPEHFDELFLMVPIPSSWIRRMGNTNSVQHFASAVDSKLTQSEEKFTHFFTQHVSELGCDAMQQQFGSAEKAGIYGIGESKQCPVQDSNLEPSD